jgi:pyruvate formate-lyase activating enzyme-like uncharacterized protein
MQTTKYFSYSNGELPRGCQLCVKGRKLVLFITGVCTKSCYFCPLSENKYHKDVIYANERPISDLKEIIEEAKKSQAQGAGITGGDPLTKLERTIKVIKLLKKEFKNFHIHLYAPLDLVSENILKQLESSGLDEIRFHPDLDNDSLWYKIKFKTKMSKGIEIPVVPNKNIKKLINEIKDYVDFINLNELEYADAKHNKLAELGFETKDDYSYGIKGSEELALKILQEFPNLKIHYCTTKLKDSVQMMNRIKLRAKNVKHSYDILTNEGTLIRGAIKGNELLKIMHQKVSKYFENDIDHQKSRLTCAKNNILKFKKELKKLNYKLEIVEELATYDQFEIESEEI